MKDITLYFADITPLTEPEKFRQIYRNLSAERKQKADTLQDFNHKCQSVGAGILLEQALTSQGLNLADFEFHYQANHKPYLQNCPFHFNLSHSGKYVICALSTEPVGCDVEQIRPVDIKIAKRFFAPGEYQKILNEPDTNRQTELFFTFWVLKESFIKALGTGLHTPLNSFEVTLEPKISIPQNTTYLFSMPAFDPAYKCAVCGTSKNIQISEIKF